MNKYEIIFNKIKLLNDIADEIAYYGVQCGIENLVDYVDMNCGAIPEGSFQLVVDQSSPEQFLSMYIQIAHSRFALAVTSVLKVSSEIMKPLQDFVKKVGENNKPQNPISNSKDAFSFVQNIILFGTLEENLSTENFESASTFKDLCDKKTDSIQKFWKKFNGDFENYNSLLECFLKGLFENEIDSL